MTDFSDMSGKNGALSAHARSGSHQKNAARAAEFLIRMKQPQLQIESVVQTASKREIERNRFVLGAIVETVTFAATQNIPLRGHRDQGRIDPSGVPPADNDGNFRGLLRFRLQSGDEVLRVHLKECSDNAKYTSKTVQNEILDDMKTLVQEAIVNKVNKSTAWTVMADETTDLSNREQMAVVIRYVDEHDGQLVIREDPVAVLDVLETLRKTMTGPELKMSGANLAEVLLGRMQKLQLDTTRLVAQSYDGAASMASAKVGVAAKVKAKAPLADYYHCAAQALNLSTSLIIKVGIIRNALDTMESVVCFLTDGAKRGEMLRQAQSMEDGKQHKLIKLCQTRFVERHVAVERFCEQLPAVNHALQLIATWEDRRSSFKAAMLLSAISKTEFLVGPVVAERLAGILRPLALALQEKGADLIKALDLIEAVKSVLQQLRAGSKKEFASLMTRVTSAAQDLDVEIKKPRLVETSTCRANAGKDTSIEGYYRVIVFNPALDHVLQDVTMRFGTHMKLVAGLSSILLKRAGAADWSQVQPAYQQFKGLLGDVTQSQVQAELNVWSAMWRDRREDAPLTAIAALNACPATIFPTMHTLLRVLSVLPVSTAEAERVFSKVTCTLTALRAAMSEDRLEALILIQAHRGQLPTTSEVMDRFAASGVRRLDFKVRL